MKRVAAIPEFRKARKYAEDHGLPFFTLTQQLHAIDQMNHSLNQL